ncbi:MAG: type IX secretion system membrane protein PorP/SprF [Bacteroidales bacterium]|nr:type IX secretion system membrane protein PorP/SprF [Bacteroidales bacterium]MBN2697597.1 type IX secretion system membrane protein PorP/SprF [Bacteroidales bacterium]
MAEWIATNRQNRNDMRNKILTICLLLSIPAGIVLAQQVPLYSQYMLNGFLLNPAVAGSEGYTAINLTAREQWLNFQDGPATYALSFQTRLLKKSYISRSSSVRKRSRATSRGSNVGLGGYIFNDRNGAVERTGFKATYAYHIKLRQSQLSFGLSLVGYQFRLDEEKIRLEYPDDNLWTGADKAVLIPDADAGVYYMGRNYWAGFSVDQMFESVLKIGYSGYDQFRMERNYYLMGGYDFEIKRDWVLAPSTLIKMAENMKLQADINMKFYYQQSYWAGLTYRTGHSIIVMAGLSIDKLVFGYAFDIGLNSIMRHSFGSHEFMFAAKFGDNARRYRWLNRF